MELYDLFLEHPQVTIDSREYRPGSIFFALKGENFNANEFAAKALENGCAYAVVEDAAYARDDRYIVVKDVLKALQELATRHRMEMGAKIIGITGSNGKTTTKELIASVLQQKYKLLYTKGNLNNHIGVPLTLLQLKPEHQLAVIEMGANHQGEIRELCEIARPDFGLITNVGKAHLEGFGSFEGVIKTKGELYEYVANNGLGIFINIDNDLLNGIAEKHHIPEVKQVTYSIKKHPDLSMVTCKVVSSDPYLTLECQTGSTFNIQTKLVGSYNTENVLAAITTGHFFGLKNSQIQVGIEQYEPQNNRSQLTVSDKNSLIVDAYNANPTSMQVAIENFARMAGEHKMLILGDMLELGDYSLKEHQAIVDLLKEKGFSEVLLTGTEFAQTTHSYKSFQNIDELYAHLERYPVKDQTILIKGSRGIQLEKIISLL